LAARDEALHSRMRARYWSEILCTGAARKRELLTRGKAPSLEVRSSLLS
jgi:hypothetical protein